MGEGRRKDVEYRRKYLIQGIRSMHSEESCGILLEQLKSLCVYFYAALQLLLSRNYCRAQRNNEPVRISELPHHMILMNTYSDV